MLVMIMDCGGARLSLEVSAFRADLDSDIVLGLLVCFRAVGDMVRLKLKLELQFLGSYICGDSGAQEVACCYMRV